MNSFQTDKLKKRSGKRSFIHLNYYFSIKDINFVHISDTADAILIY
jgi:hypothetical protein